MATLFERGVALRDRATEAVAGIYVTYIRGVNVVGELLTLPVEIRDSDFGGDVMQLTARERDWLFWADDLALNGVPLTPERGDIIRWIDPRGQTHRYDVLPRLGERCYRFTDQSMTQLRVFTVEAAKGNL